MSEQQNKHHGEGHPFFPGHLLKEVIVMLGVIIVLMIGASLIDLPKESIANPTDTSYIPRPDWYFLFLFQLLKYFPGSLEVVAAIILPGVSIGVLVFLPFLDKNPARHPKKRPLASSTAIVTLVGIVVLTVIGLLDSAPSANAEHSIGFFEKWKYGVIISIIFINFVVTWMLVGKNSPVKDGASKMITASVLTVLSIIGLSTVFVFSALAPQMVEAGAGGSAGLGDKGAVLFEANCGTCHKANGKGSGAIDLSEKAKALGVDGVLGKLASPPAGMTVSSSLSDEDKKAIAEFLAGGGGAAPTGSSAAPASGNGGTAFETNCGGCHKANGKGSGAIDLSEKGKTLGANGVLDKLANPPAGMVVPAGISDDDKKAISEFLSGGGAAPAASGNQDATAVNNKDAGLLFESKCGGCHKANGKGSGAIDLTDKGKTLGSSGVLEKLGNPPAGMVIPADLTDDDKKAIAGFVGGSVKK